MNNLDYSSPRLRQVCVTKITRCVPFDLQVVMTNDKGINVKSALFWVTEEDIQ